MTATATLQRHTVWIMAIASGAASANLYYNQPLLALIQEKLHASAHLSGFIPVLTQIGYAVGILLIVPLGDLLKKRKLILIMLGLRALGAYGWNHWQWQGVCLFALLMLAVAFTIFFKKNKPKGDKS